jgi:hypothetical protein
LVWFSSGHYIHGEMPLSKQSKMVMKAMMEEDGSRWVLAGD